MNRDTVDALLVDAHRLHVSGNTSEALQALTIASAELFVHGKKYPLLFEWMAQLQQTLGEYAGAERSALAARALEDEAGNLAGQFRVQLLRARIAREAGDLDTSQTLLAELRSDREPLGAVLPQRLQSIVSWIDQLRFSSERRVNHALLRVEAAMSIAELWYERGAYRSALALVDHIDSDLVAAAAVVNREQVRLFASELMLAEGSVDQARTELDAIVDPTGPLERIRLATARARVALANARLQDAMNIVTDTLEPALTELGDADAQLLAAAVATAAAVLVELNLLDHAATLVRSSITRLEPRPDARRHVDALRRTELDIDRRKRSAISLWELPLVPEGLRGGVGNAAPLPEVVPTSTSRFMTVWTARANDLIVALEGGEHAAARRLLESLRVFVRGAESRSISAVVRLCETLVDYYSTGASPRSVEAFVSAANELGDVGARLARAHALRFAAWAAARLQRIEDYVALARESSAIIDAIAGTLDQENRLAFLMNKWSGRDELVSARVREVTGGCRRDICRAFRDVDQLTQWPIDEALSDVPVGLDRNAVPDDVMVWIRDRLATKPRDRGFTLRSPLSLWRFPRRTVALHYHVLPDRTFLFRIARRHIDVLVLPVGKLHVSADLRSALEVPDELEWLAESFGIRDTLKRFPGLDRLLIIPHDVVAGIPFAALPHAGGALCEGASICHLDRLDRLRTQYWYRRGKNFGGVAISDYAGSGYKNLPSTLAELNAVTTQVGRDATTLRDGAATHARIAELLTTTQRAHVAAHGTFDLTAPGESGILVRDDAGGYRTLTLRELRRMDLSRLRLVTLATCRSAEGAQLPGRERICIPTALLDAGAHAVIASLWPVEDAPSVDVMTTLYTHLRGDRPSRALAKTQAELSRRGMPARNWAGLVYYGTA